MKRILLLCLIHLACTNGLYAQKGTWLKAFATNRISNIGIAYSDSFIFVISGKDSILNAWPDTVVNDTNSRQLFIGKYSLNGELVRQTIISNVVIPYRGEGIYRHDLLFENGKLYFLAINGRKQKRELSQDSLFNYNIQSDSTTFLLTRLNARTLNIEHIEEIPTCRYPPIVKLLYHNNMFYLLATGAHSNKSYLENEQIKEREIKLFKIEPKLTVLFTSNEILKRVLSVPFLRRAKFGTFGCYGLSKENRAQNNYRLFMDTMGIFINDSLHISTYFDTDADANGRNEIGFYAGEINDLPFAINNRKIAFSDTLNTSEYKIVVKGDDSLYHININAPGLNKHWGEVKALGNEWAFIISFARTFPIANDTLVNPRKNETQNIDAHNSYAFVLLDSNKQVKHVSRLTFGLDFHPEEIEQISDSKYLILGYGLPNIFLDKPNAVNYVPYFLYLIDIHAFQDTILAILPIVSLYAYPYFPNAFTPNSDGLNDEWTPFADETNIYYNLKIMDKNGVLVYSYNGYSPKWNGKTNNETCESGAYYISATTTLNGKVKTYNSLLYLMR